MEVVGAVASIVTLTKLVLDGVKLAKTLYKAPDDLAALQDQLECFNVMLAEIEKCHNHDWPGLVSTTLGRARLTIEQIHQLVELKLLKTNGSTSRARRRAWARHKSKIHSLRDALRECRENLTTALSASSSSLSHRAEARLSFITQGIDLSRQSANTITKSLSEIQQSLEATRGAIQVQSQTVNDILRSVSSAAGLHRGRGNNEHMLAYPTFGGFLRPLVQVTETHGNCQHAAAELASFTGSRNHWPRSTEISRLDCATDISIRLNPASSFELSDQFFPELYTVLDGPLNVRLHAYSAYEEHSTELARTNCYGVFLLKAQRQWQRLTISVQISRNSRFWDYTKLSRSKPNYVTNSYHLPRSLQVQAAELLMEVQGLVDDAHLSFTVSENTHGHPSVTWSQEKTAPRHNPVGFANDEVLSLLDDLGCQRAFENEIMQVAMLQAPECFATSVNGHLLHEYKISGLAGECSLYTIQLLHCLSGFQHIAKLAAVILDSKGRQLKGFLREIPARGWLFGIIAKSLADGQPVPWSRREKWAKQIVEAVSHIHSKGFVVGTLGELSGTPIAVDNEDRALLWKFRNKAWANRRFPGHLPPEYWQQTGQGTDGTLCEIRDELVDVTPRCDIFQLGMALWLIASKRLPLNGWHLFQNVDSQSTTSFYEHANIIALPPLSDEVPQYYKDIIAACRSVTPTTRPTARRLLQMFPSNITPTTRELQSPFSITSPEKLISNFPQVAIYCDICRAEKMETIFHCDSCLCGDFDICARCFEEGAHCHDSTHFLVEMTTKHGVLLAVNNYHSCVKDEGRREIMHL
ncbi:hypothetical protein DL98DRAFT_647652 [Cadophora sp. DSE1049]|nr:hypothetical protein DL98DRAFT_647652 [Cadophora sp. DSE1049]